MFSLPPAPLVRGVLGGRIRTMREERGLTQQQLAEQLDMNQSWLSRIESGDRGIQPEQLRAICIVLQVSSDFLLML
jgi:transcriptional regulator with XRE-family HTH domain